MNLGANGGYEKAWKEFQLIELLTNKDFDGNKYGYKDKFIKLKSEIEKVMPGK